MLLLLGILAFCPPAPAGVEVLVTTTEPVDPVQAFSEFMLSGWCNVGGNTYLLQVEGACSPAGVIAQLAEHMNVASAEPNQRTSLDLLESAGSIDSRIVFVIDEVQAEATYVVDEGELDSRIVFVIDGSGDAYRALYGQYHVTEVRAHMAWSASNGEDTTVAVIDTGVDLTHPFLAGNLVPGFDFVDFDEVPDDVRADLDTNGNGKLDEGWGHGTHVAGIVKTIAPGARIMPIRVVDSDGQADLAAIVAGVDYAVTHGAKIINLSMSIGAPSAALDEAMRRAWDAGVVIVTSAGNAASDDIMFPGEERGVLTVSALDVDRKLAAFSNYGNAVDVCAPGVGIVSCHPGGAYVRRDGTSMASPIVAGEAALLHTVYGGNNESWLRSKIRTTAENVDRLNTGYEGRLGHGIINAEALFSH